MLFHSIILKVHAPAHRGGGALPAPAFPGTLPPTPPPRAEGRGSDGKLGAKRARAHVRGTGEAKRGRESRTDGRRRRGGGGGRGAGDSPEARKAWGGAWRPARQAQSGGRPTTGRGRPAQGRRREAAGQGRRTRDGEPPPVTPHSPPDATRGSAPRGPRPLTGGRQSCGEERYFNFNNIPSFGGSTVCPSGTRKARKVSQVLGKLVVEPPLCLLSSHHHPLGL